MKIIAGTLKGRTIETNKAFSYRPITGIIKEAIFSILKSEKFISRNNFQNATTLDLFAGTGALTFEAISRGVKKSIMIDQNTSHISMLHNNVQKFELSDKIIIIRSNSLSLPKSKEKCNIVFIDPPFNQSMVTGCIKSLISQQWLHKDALLIIRTHIKDEYEVDDSCKKVFTRKYGNSLLVIYKANI